jgi:hypothetical protein
MRPGAGRQRAPANTATPSLRAPPFRGLFKLPARAADKQERTEATCCAMPEPQDFLTRAPRDLAGWVACFDVLRLPVLARTADELEDWRPAQDEVDAHLLAQTLSTDPLMILKLLAHLARLRR